MIIRLENTQDEIVHDIRHQEMPQNSTYWCEHYLWQNQTCLLLSFSGIFYAFWAPKYALWISITDLLTREGPDF